MSEEFDLEFEPGTEAGEFDDDYVEATEEMINLEFDPDFLDFLKAHNGGVTKKKYFRLDENVKVVERFLSLVPNYKENEKFGQFDIGVVWSQIEDRLDEFLLPFAAVFGGDFLCFDYEEDDETPEVVLWAYDLSEEGDPYTVQVADNFKQFLSMLTDDGGSS